MRLSWNAAEALEEFSTPSHQGGGYERATELTLPTFQQDCRKQPRYTKRQQS
jgi:hypothetical protein